MSLGGLRSPSDDFEKRKVFPPLPRMVFIPRRNGSYAGGSLATGRVSLAGQVKADDPDEKGYLGPPYWGLGVRPVASLRKIAYVVKTPNTRREGLMQ